MLSAIAKDSAWNGVSWQGSNFKISFVGTLTHIHTAIKKIAIQTYPKTDRGYFDSRIKTFLRHTAERIQRSNRNAEDIET